LAQRRERCPHRSRSAPRTTGRGSAVMLSRSPISLRMRKCDTSAADI